MEIETFLMDETSGKNQCYIIFCKYPKPKKKKKSTALEEFR